MNRAKIRKKLKKNFKYVVTQYKRWNIGNDWKEFARKNNQGYELTSEEKSQFDNNYKKYGNSSYEIAAYYAANTGKFDADYIPDDLYYNYIDRFYNDWDMAVVFDNKCFYDLFFPNIKHPDTVAMKINNIWFDKNRNLISLDKVFELLKCEQSYFIKIAIESDGGHGVYYLSKNDSIDKAKKIIGGISKDIIIQKPIVQHHKMSQLNESSVNSIRVLTLLEQDGVKICSSLVRIGSEGSKVDNNSSGGTSCGIDENGQLKKYIYSGIGERRENKEFKDFIIPGFNKILDESKKLACQVPYFRLVSWDFAVDYDENPILIEANLCYGGIDFHQLNNGPIFGKDAPEVLNEVFSNQKK